MRHFIVITLERMIDDIGLITEMRRQGLTFGISSDIRNARNEIASSMPAPHAHIIRYRTGPHAGEACRQCMKSCYEMIPTLYLAQGFSQAISIVYAKPSSSP